MLDQHFSMRVFSALLFAVIFGLLGWAIPETYFRYFDKTQYYVVEQPVSVDKTIYQPCEDTVVTLVRTALVDTIGEFEVDLRLIDVDGVQFNVNQAHISRVASIAGGKTVVRASYPLPCDIPEGVYFWQATIRYHVNDIEKQYVYVTQTFQVLAELPEDGGITTQPTFVNPSATNRLPQQGTPVTREVIIESPEFTIVNQQPTQSTVRPAEAKEPQGPPEETPPEETPPIVNPPKVCLPIVGCVL